MALIEVVPLIKEKSPNALMFGKINTLIEFFPTTQIKPYVYEQVVPNWLLFKSDTTLDFQDIHIICPGADKQIVITILENRKNGVEFSLTNLPKQRLWFDIIGNNDIKYIEA